MIRLMNAHDDVIGPINLSKQQEFTILNLAATVIDLIGSRSQIVHRPRPEDDPRQRRPDISKAQDLLDWKPRTLLKDGLTSTIAHFNRLLSDSKLRAQLVKEPAA